VINVTAKTYRYLDEEEQATEADAGRQDKPKGTSQGSRSEGTEG